MTLQRIVAATLLAALAVPMAAIWTLLVATAGRPVLFRQERSGLHGQVFTLVKFRTMTERRDAARQLLPDDERVTRIGRFLRRFRLDELPELWNIARGEMAFVGPRPLLPETISLAGAAGRVRGMVRPGLTGWAQVNGNTLLSLEDKLALDQWYVRNADPRLDLEILLRTFLVMLFGERLREGTLHRFRRSGRGARRG